MYSVIGTDGQVYGPASMDTLKQWCQEGRIQQETNMIDPLDGRVLRAREVPGLEPWFSTMLAPPLPTSSPMPVSSANYSVPIQPLPGDQQGFVPIQINNYITPPSDPYLRPPPAHLVYVPQRNKAVAILLALFLGCFGIHRYYMGHSGTATAMLLITVLTCGYGGIVTGLWALIDIILIATGGLLDAQNQPLT